MKLKFIAISGFLMLVSIFNSSFGQTDYPNYPYNTNRPAFVIPGKGFMEYGVSIGVGVSVCSGQTGDRHYGVLNAYLSAERYFSNRWGLKVDLTYDQKGWNVPDDWYNSNGFNSNGYNSYYNKRKVTLHYLTIPVMANWHFGRTRKWYLDFGPYIGFLLSPNVKVQNEDFNSVDGGLAFGIGVKLPISSRLKFFIELNEQQGFANVLPKNEIITAYNIARSSLNIGINF